MLFRSGFRKFFGEHRRITLVAGGNKPETEKDFIDGTREHPESLVLMLIDSDGPLSHRRPDPTRFFMVQVMESWFLADREALAKYFGDGFKAKALPGSPNAIESIPKQDVKRGLDNATRPCHKVKYSLGKVGYGRELLSRINPILVRAASPECERLFQAFGLP